MVGRGRTLLYAIILNPFGGEIEGENVGEREIERETGWNARNQHARINLDLHGIANIAARNGVDKSADRVRKYAEKCLKTSHDPLDRSRAYSLLASCEEVGEGEFADRRRKAAEWLLAGYFELLAQELPDERPAVPAKRLKIDDFPPDPDRGVQYYNWCKAYEKAKWEGEQSDRRDVRVQQLRSLYEPNAKVHGHTTDGPHELRKLAEAKLPTAEDAEKLVERVSEK